MYYELYADTLLRGIDRALLSRQRGLRFGEFEIKQGKTCM
jgi:hypothetical protein